MTKSGRGREGTSSESYGCGMRRKRRTSFIHKKKATNSILLRPEKERDECLRKRNARILILSGKVAGAPLLGKGILVPGKKKGGGRPRATRKHLFLRRGKEEEL